MGQNPSGISTRIDKARLLQDLNALEEVVVATPGCLNGPARLLAFQLVDTVAQALKRYNIYADVRLELSIAIRAIPPRVEDKKESKKPRVGSDPYHSQALESIAFLRSMFDERRAASAV
jgi:hypothetical protein